MSSLLESLATLDESAAAFLSGKTSDTRALLAAIFSVNNEIGVLLRQSGDPALRALQLRVNDLTVAAKTFDREKVRVASDALMKAARDLRPANGRPERSSHRSGSA